MSRSVRQFAHRSLRAVATSACIAGLLTAAGTVYAQGLYQQPSPNLGTATTPYAVASADFARSGFRSLAVAVSSGSGVNSTNDVEVYLATGANTYASGVTYPTCKGTAVVLAQDLNSDGYTDLAVACPKSNTVDVLLNNGASSPGTFGAATPYTVTGPAAMVAGSFRNNGQTDIAVASSGAGVTVLVNNGSGSFTTKTSAAAGTLSGIAAGDFNHDGILDVAVSNSAAAAGNVRVLFGDGTGSFTSNATYTAGSKPGSIVTTDFNNDGNFDLAVTNAAGNAVNVLLGTATGTFGTAVSYSAGTDPVGLTVADVNSDGAPDVIAMDAQQAGSNNVGATAVLLGNGDGTLQSAQISNLSAVPGSIAAIDDFNRDGKPDFAITQSSNQVSVLLNNTLPTAYPDGRSYSAYRALNNGYGNMADSIATGDFNKDGRLDIAVAYLEDNAVRVLTNNGNGFNGASVYPVGQQPYFVASGDLNGDGYADLVTANTTPNAATGTVSVLLNNGKTGNGTFAAAVNYPVGKDPYQVAIGDLNGDGYPDLAVTNYGSNTVSILMGSKAGTFTPSATTLSTCVNPFGVAIGDFKHNGHPSIAVTCYKVAQAEVFTNNGDGTFGGPIVLTTNANPGPLLVGDFNRDGNLDIVVGNTSANNVSFFAGNGNNGFGVSATNPNGLGVTSPSLNFPVNIAAGDINGDGILDIVGVAPNFNNVVVTLGVGDGTFGTFNQRSAGEFSSPKQPWSVALGDFNNDGLLDIVTANTYYQVNIAQPAYQQRYMAEFPAIPAGNPSIDVLSNASAANIALAFNPNTFPLPAVNSGVTITATVSPRLSGPTPTGSVGFEGSNGQPLGASPYTLSGGQASYSTGQLGSGQYVFTTLYSGDSNFQPTTVSGAGVAVTVSGTPVALTLTPNSLQYGQTFTAAVTVTGNPGNGAPRGTVTLYDSTGAFTLGPIALTPNGNNSTGTHVYTAVQPDFNVGTYQLYAYYTPANGSPYLAGTSSDEQLVVTPEPTSTSDFCFGILGFGFCNATVKGANPGGPVISGTVDFSVSFNGGPFTTPAPVNVNNAGNALWFYGGFNKTGTYTVDANFLTGGNYLGSTSSIQVDVTCTIIFGFNFCIGGGNVVGGPVGGRPIPFGPLTGLHSNRPIGRNNLTVPFDLLLRH